MSPGASAARVRPRAELRALVWLWLGLWLGAMALFGWVARVAFSVIPSSHVAGDVVGHLLGPLLIAGAISGVGIAFLGGILGRGRVAVALPLLLSAACLVNQFGVSRAIAEIDLSAPSLAAGEAARFATLHRLSVWLFLATGIGALALVGVHALAERREVPRGTPPVPARSA